MQANRATKSGEYLRDTERSPRLQKVWAKVHHMRECLHTFDSPEEAEVTGVAGMDNWVKDGVASK